ncbi:MAG TPA: radical SAM protein, partial [Bacillota bacterium]|nr:radical SAM protein [Bacillota bacterium]
TDLMKFRMLYADKDGQLFDHPGFQLVGKSGNCLTEPLPEEMIPLPEGASLTMIPGGTPIGTDRQGRFRLVKAAGTARPAQAVGALLPQGYTRTLLPAYQGVKGDKPLPLLCYTAAGLYRDQIYVAAVQTDHPAKWNPCSYNTEDLPARVAKLTGQFPENRILRQLAHCSLEYACLTAQNIFYRRWEAGIPVSPVCNANCLGCISLQPAECCPSPQRRLDFMPSVQEVVELAVPHLSEAEEAIISFGQGCEGEPSLSYPVLVPAIREIRAQTRKGTININTNAGNTLAIREITQAGLDAMRVSIIGPGEEAYNAYYRPSNYTLSQVVESIKVAKGHGVYVSLNLLTLPGLTDREEEVEKLLRLVRETGIDLIQLRNLNIDPDWLLSKLAPRHDEILGITRFLQILREEVPGVEVGSFSRAVR